ncbi:ubiquitin carboxyl-terminal hydrolase 47-like isoform X2 [Centropristis striata]|uniref:ubiquitin carboxyl-terminal hydrolase 47-like isoform X2 n=1 Tax=Centropristis striata TaxID=184440 RepID=UPI0027DEE6B5|nr:ubiquitin carboxyl-terminal hydrolase 47-like isoform X2 [Centropristis striata]
MGQPNSHHGLYNQGATCYLNSILQVLYMTPEFNSRLKKKSPADRELRKIFEGLKEKTYRIENITGLLEMTEDVYQQRDAAECLEMILRKVSPKASEVFEGRLRCTTKCSQGHIIIEETNPFRTLSLSLNDTQDKTYDVESSFQDLKGNNVYCKECQKKTDATKECEMVEDPQILALLLKRFDIDYNTMSYVKSDCKVNVPHTLKTKNKRYSLYGMVNHMGSLSGGHYTATILSDEDQTWYEFDDDRVREVKKPPHSSQTAYLLVYRDENSPRGSQRLWNKYTMFFCCCLVLGCCKLIIPKLKLITLRAKFSVVCECVSKLRGFTENLV